MLPLRNLKGTQACEILSASSNFKFSQGGGTCENFDRDARVIFLGLKFTKMSFFGFR